MRKIVIDTDICSGLGGDCDDALALLFLLQNPDLARVLFEPDIALLTLGALTNLALALSLEPRIKGRLKDTVIMGGVIGEKKREYNIACDPAAARVVFRSGTKFTLVGLDVTRKVNLTKDEVAQLAAIESPAAQIATDVSQQWLSLRRGDRFSLHDPLAAAVLLDKSIVRTENMSLDVDDVGPEGGAINAQHHQNGNPVALEVKDVLATKKRIIQGIWKT